MTEEFVQGAVSAKTEWQSMAEQIKNVGLEDRKVHDESAIDQRKPVENLAKSYEDIIKAKKRVAQADIDIADALKELAKLTLRHSIRSKKRQPKSQRRQQASCFLQRD